MFKIANIPCRIIKFCECSAYSPSPVTNALDEFSNDDPLVSIVVFRTGTDGNVITASKLIFSLGRMNGRNKLV